MSPPERPSPSDSALESPRVMMSSIPHESSSHTIVHQQMASQPQQHQHILSPAPQSQQMNQNQNYPQQTQQNHLQHKQHQLLQQNGVSVTSVQHQTSVTNEACSGGGSLGAGVGISTATTTITTTTHHLGNGSYATVMTSSSSEAASSSSSSTVAASSSLATNNNNGMASKLMVLHPNQLNESFITTSDAPAGGNIVLLATETMDFISTGPASHVPHQHVTIIGNSDEELTPLNWLHDKNLLKGINLTCTANPTKPIATAKIEHNSSPSHITAAVSPRSSTNQSPYPQSSHSPTSDYMDDSYVSEENVSPVNSSSDRGISIYSPTNRRRSQTEQSCQIGYTVTGQLSTHHPQTVLYTNTHNNNNTSTINRNNRTHQPQVIRIGSSDTVFEYKTASVQPKFSSTLNLSVVTSSESSASSNALTTPVESDEMHVTNGVVRATSSSALTSSTSTNTSNIMHFHKKYLREEQQKAMKQTINTSTLPVQLQSATVQTGQIIYHQQQPFSTTTFVINNKPAQTQYEGPLISPVETNTSSSVGGELHHNLVDQNSHDDANSADESEPKLLYSRSELSTPDSFLSPASSPHSTPSKHCSTTDPIGPINVSSGASGAQSPQKPKHPSNLPYDPMVHTANKPPLSFSSLIFLAIDDSLDKALPVKEIYAWIVAHYPYFKTAPTGWKNSVRHNLSLNKCFQKVEKAPNMGKGSLWRVEQQYKQNLIQALNRSSYHPCTTSLDKPTAPFNKTSPRPADCPTYTTNVRGALNAELYPRLSKYMAEIVSTNAGTATLVPQNGGTAHIIHHQRNNILIGRGSVLASDSPSPPGSPPGSDDCFAGHPFNNATTITNNHNNNTIVINNNAAGATAGCFVSTDNGTSIFYNGSAERLVRDWGADSIDDVNAATAMLALKHGPKVFQENYQSNGNALIITSSPSEDHTYSAGGLNSNGMPNAVAGITVHSLKCPNINNHSDNNSNGTLSDAAYESSEESQTPRIVCTPEEIEAQRHAEGVDAFLTFATEVSSMSSPLKRPASVDSQHSGHFMMENIPNNYIIDSTIYSAGATPSSGGSASGSTMSSPTSPFHHPLNNNLHHHYQAQYLHHHQYATLTTNNGTSYHLSSPSPPKKPRARTLRTKLKKKSAWLR